MQVKELTRLLRESEADRAARLQVIRGAEAQILTLSDDIENLRRRMAPAERPPRPEL